MQPASHALGSRSFHMHASAATSPVFASCARSGRDTAASRTRAAARRVLQPAASRSRSSSRPSSGRSRRADPTPRRSARPRRAARATPRSNPARGSAHASLDVTPESAASPAAFAISGADRQPAGATSPEPGAASLRPHAAQTTSSISRSEPYLLAVVDAEARARVGSERDDARFRRRHARADRTKSRPRVGQLDADDRPALAVASRPRARRASSRRARPVMSSVAAMKCGTAVERIDLAAVVEPDPAEHLLDAFRLLADLADDRRDIRRQQLGVDRIVGEQRVDELLVVLRQPIGFLIREAREAAAERLPQLRGAIGLERRQQLREHLIAKQRRDACA